MPRFLLMLSAAALFLANPLATRAAGPTTAPAAGDKEALPIVLPKPAYTETPKNLPPGVKVEKPHGKREPFLAPKGSVNLALKKPVTSSENDPVIGSLDMITDGNKDATEGSYVELGRGVQWVMIDLGSERPISAVVVWHYHGQARVYHSVIVQISNDKDFKTGVTTIFNNDDENAAGQGAGTDLGYWESNEGKLFDAKGAKGRYVRLFSNGNTSDEQTHYTEVEVWGQPK